MGIARRRRVIDKDIEKKILTGLIVSDKILAELSPILTPNLFELEYCRTISRWVLDYFNVYKESPKRHIQDMFKEHRSSLKEADEDMISSFLEELSLAYESEGLNEEYLIDISKNYLRKQALSFACDRAKTLIDKNLIEEAESVFRSFNSTSRLILGQWVKPFDDMSFVASVFSSDTEFLMQLEGDLGEMIGPLKRGYLIGLMGFMKKGKTWNLQEFALQAVSQKLKTVLITLEMQDIHLTSRLYQSVGSYGEKGGEFKFPVMDCRKNQDDSCKLNCRTNKFPLPERFSPSSPYLPCTACRGNGKFEPSTWFSIQKRPALSHKDVVKRVKDIQKMYGKNLLRLKSYPPFAANISDIKNDLDLLEYSEGFIPDVIIVDYADILAPEKESESVREQIGTTWKMLKNLAYVRKALVITASQSNRGSAKKALLEEEDTAEDIRKLAHVDAMLSLNQTEEEKEKGVIRIGLMNHRWKKFSRTKQVMLLQQLEVGQANLDNNWFIYHQGKRPSASFKSY